MSKLVMHSHSRIVRDRIDEAFMLPNVPASGIQRIRGIEGQSGRLTGEAEWKRTIITDGGLVITPLLAFQADADYFNASSASLQAIDDMAAARGLTAAAALRVNPDVDAGTHAKISTGKAENKFGVGIDVAPEIFDRLARLPGLKLRGIALHIGSQLTSLAPLEAAFERVGRLVADLRAAGHSITHVDLGGGLGVPYRPDDNPPSPADYGAMVARVTRDWDVTLMFEPGTASRIVPASPFVSSVTSMSTVPTSCFPSSNRAMPVVPSSLPST